MTHHSALWCCVRGFPTCIHLCGCIAGFFLWCHPPMLPPLSLFPGVTISHIYISANRELHSSEYIQEGCGDKTKGSGFALGRQLIGSGKSWWDSLSQLSLGYVWLCRQKLQNEGQKYAMFCTSDAAVEGTKQHGATSCTGGGNGEKSQSRGNRIRKEGGTSVVFPVLGYLGSCVFQGWQNTAEL